MTTMKIAPHEHGPAATRVRLTASNWIALGAFIGGQTIALVIIAATAFTALDKRLVRVETLLSEVATHRQQSTESRITRIENTLYGNK